MRIKKTLYSVLFFSTALIGLYLSARFYYSLTDDFSVSSISSELQYDPKWEATPISQEKKEELSSILDQPFQYLGKGTQSFVLLSEDQRYVIKFFKFKHLELKSWLSQMPLPSFLKKYQDASLKRKREKLERLFNGAIIAFEEIPEKTGVIYIHLNKTNELHQHLHFYDKLGFSHQIDLDNFEFIIQRKVISLLPRIEMLMEQGQLEKIDMIFKSIITTLKSCCEQGILDKDNDDTFIRNVGLTDDDTLIILDFGQFVKDDRIKKPEVYRTFIKNRLRYFEDWLQANYPSLIHHLHKALDKLELRSNSL